MYKPVNISCDALTVVYIQYNHTTVTRVCPVLLECPLLICIHCCSGAKLHKGWQMAQFNVAQRTAVYIILAPL